MDKKLFRNRGGRYKYRAEELTEQKDRLFAFMAGVIEERHLYKGDLEKLVRLEKIWSLLVNYHSPYQAVKRHMKVCELEGNPISNVTAWSEMRMATNLFGDSLAINKQAQLVILKELQMQIYQLAAKNKDVKEMNKAAGTLLKITVAQQEVIPQNTGNTTYVLQINQVNINGANVNDTQEPKTIPIEEIRRMKQAEFAQLVEAIETDQVDTRQMAKLLQEHERSNEEFEEAVLDEEGT